MNEKSAQEQNREQAARDYLNGYRLCHDMLNLRQYERKRAKASGENFRNEDGLAGNEAFWKSRMVEVEHLISSLRNGREKLVLYYHYIRGESIERTADLLGVSRRTGYRLHQRGLLVVGSMLERMRKHEISFSKFENSE